MRSVDPAIFRPDFGLEGCRHAVAGSRRQVLLLEAETLDALDLEPGRAKENVTTHGIDLTVLPVNSRLFLGDAVELWVTGPCHPCGLMDEIREGLQEELQGRRGIVAWVKTGGRVGVGDAIRAEKPSAQGAEE